jgi:hypothetical protein
MMPSNIFLEWGKIKYGVMRRVNSWTLTLHCVHKWPSAKNKYFIRANSIC